MVQAKAVELELSDNGTKRDPIYETPTLVVVSVIILGFVIFAIANLAFTVNQKGSFTVEDRSNWYEISDNLSYAEGVVLLPPNSESCNIKFYSRSLYLGVLGSLPTSDSHATANCKTGEFSWTDDNVEEATYDPNTGEWQIIMKEEPGGSVHVSLTGDYNWTLGWGSYCVYIIMNLICLALVGKVFLPPSFWISITAIILPPLVAIVGFDWMGFA